MHAQNKCFHRKQWSGQVQRAKCFLLNRARKHFCFLLDWCASCHIFNKRKHVLAKAILPKAALLDWCAPGLSMYGSITVGTYRPPHSHVVLPVVGLWLFCVCTETQLCSLRLFGMGEHYSQQLITTLYDIFRQFSQGKQGFWFTNAAVTNPDQYFRYTASFICHNFAYNCNSCIAFHLSTIYLLTKFTGMTAPFGRTICFNLKNIMIKISYLSWNPHFKLL